MIQGQICNQWPFKRVGVTRFIKRHTSKHRRKQIKNYLKGIGKEPNDKQYNGYSN